MANASFVLGLIAQAGHTFGVRADEGDAVFPAGCGKLRIFGEEAVAGVDGLRAGEQRGGENALLAEVAVLRRGRTDADAPRRRGRHAGSRGPPRSRRRREAMPISLQARMIRTAISPRLAIRILENIRFLHQCEGKLGLDGELIADEAAAFGKEKRGVWPS